MKKVFYIIFFISICGCVSYGDSQINEPPPTVIVKLHNIKIQSNNPPLQMLGHTTKVRHSNYARPAIAKLLSPKRSLARK